jgi:hypothetical protein
MPTRWKQEKHLNKHNHQHNNSTRWYKKKKQNLRKYRPAVILGANAEDECRIGLSCVAR